MQALRIVVVLCAFGLGHSTPVQSDGIKSAGSVGIKGHDGTTKYAFEDPQKISSPGQVVRVQSGSVGWQSPTADVVPSQVEAHQEGQYVPVINVKPGQKVEWISPAMKKQYVGEEVFEQRKEEPVMVSSYEPIIGPQMSSDPYREILPEVIHDKRRLGEEDVPISVHSEVSPFSGPRMVSVGMFGKAPVKQYVYGDKSVPQHGYTEDSFPSIITLKGRQYLVVPHKTGSQIQPYYASSTVPYPFSWESHSDYVPSVQQQSQVYQSVPVRDVGGQQVVKQGHVYGLLPVSQTLTGQSVHTVPSTSFVPQQQSPGQSGGYVAVPPASSSLPSPNYERPVSVVSTAIQSDYSPYVQPITQKVPYFSPYWYTHPQVYATKYSAYVPQVQVPKTQVAHSPVTQSSWGWVSAPQYISKEVVRPGSWVVKGVRKGEVFGDVPSQYDVRGASGVKTWVRSVDSEQKTKWYSPSVKQASGKGWYIYSPISPAPWSYGVPQQIFGGAPSVSAWAPQYGGQWEVPEGGKVVAPSQWSGPAAGEQWSVKQGQQSVSQGVSYVPSFGQKIKSVPTVPETAGYQGSAVHSGLHYAVEINHGPSGSASIHQAPQVGSEVVSEQHGTKSGSVQAQAPIDQSS